MYLRYLLVLSYIYFCVRTRTNPSRYFQLNAAHFNMHKGIFSKLDIDQLIPSRWRLRQCVDDGISTDFSYPVFVKPEWGQNAHGVQRADNPAQLRHIRRRAIDRKMPHIIQEAAPGTREFEIFWVRSADDAAKPAVMTVSEAVNPAAERFPINSVKNRNTVYLDLSNTLSNDQLDSIWQHLQALGSMPISRAGVRANSIEDLAAGRFHVIEINLFVPMPIHVLDPAKSLRERVRDILDTTHALARVTSRIPANQLTRPIFFRKWRLARRNKMLPLAR